MFQENFSENITHLSLLYKDDLEESRYTDVIDKVKELLQDELITKHPPIFIYGSEGSGKTTLIRNLFQLAGTWFHGRLIRIMRFVQATPRASYSLELVRIFCQQICISLKLPDGFLPKDASFDPIYINNWFQNLMRLFDDLNQTLLIFVDDIHLLNSSESDVMSVLAWLPLSLPCNVHLICTTGQQMDFLKLTPLQKDRLRHPSWYFELPLRESTKSKLNSVF